MAISEQGRAELSATVDWQRPVLFPELCWSGCHLLNRISRIIACPLSIWNSLPPRSIFYRHGVGHGSMMVCSYVAQDGLSRQVVLTRSEASLLVRLLIGQSGDES